MNRPPKCPTWTTLVVEALGHADDFLGLPELQAKTGGSANQLTAALYWLKACHRVDSVVSNGRLYWFLLPEIEDQRSRHLDQRTPESRPRRPRGGQGLMKAGHPSPARIKASKPAAESGLAREIREANEIAARIQAKKT